MIEPQDELRALVTARNLGDLMNLLPGVGQRDCTQLTAALVERRRDLNLFASQIGFVEVRQRTLQAEIDTAQIARDRRATELDAAADREQLDETALRECLLHGVGMVGGECTVQERFHRQSADALRAARAALVSATASLQALQVQDSEISRELLSLRADHVAIGEEIDQIILIMQQQGCPIPAE